MFKKYALKIFLPKYSNLKLIANSLTNSLINNLTNNAFNMDFFCNYGFEIHFNYLKYMNLNFKGKKIKVDAP
jgi:hypothetical protein